MRTSLLGLAPVAALMLSAAGCAVNPVTGERELALISEAQEIQMGQQAAEQVEASLGLVDDAGLQSYVRRIGQQLAAASERPSLPWRFGVIEDPTPNAFALPGGFIYVTRGLLTLMDTEAELASVLGHEIGHVTARHSVSAISRAQLAQLGFGLGSVLFPELGGVAQIAGAGMELLFLKYGRDDENQADDLGFRYALTEGYDVREMADVFTALRRSSELAGQSPVPGWLSTHPDPGDRIENVQARISALNRSLDGLRVERAAYMDQLDGLVFGDNPRNGFFEGSAFLHPDLRFRIDFPSGWQAQNLPQAVMAGSPQQDALIELTLAQGADAAAAAQQFFGQEGINAGSVSRQTVNGNPAVTGYFEAQTQSGTLRGLAVFITYGGRAYRLLGYAPANRFASYDSALRQSLTSFRPLTDARALAVQPDRIRVVRPTTSLTLREFAQRYPSAIELDLLALINQVASADVRVPAATPLKQVVSGSE